MDRARCLSRPLRPWPTNPSRLFDMTSRTPAACRSGWFRQLLGARTAGGEVSVARFLSGSRSFSAAQGPFTFQQVAGESEEAVPSWAPSPGWGGARRALPPGRAVLQNRRTEARPGGDSERRRGRMHRAGSGEGIRHQSITHLGGVTRTEKTAVGCVTQKRGRNVQTQTAESHAHVWAVHVQI